MAVHAQLALAEATGSLHSLLVAVQSMRRHQPAADGSNSGLAPGLGQRVCRLHAAINHDFSSSQLSGEFGASWTDARRGNCTVEPAQAWGSWAQIETRLSSLQAAFGLDTVTDDGSAPRLRSRAGSSASPPEEVRALRVCACRCVAVSPGPPAGGAQVISGDQW